MALRVSLWFTRPAGPSYTHSTCDAKRALSYALSQVIGELDEKKAQALHLTWEKVNKDFGSIFSTLLPGTMAKLEPPEGGSVLDGLEVRVAFGTVWKESLTELSGGQRSLLALSLILALLLFKPAPIYILDEVDAALDLSHTQNIGYVPLSHTHTHTDASHVPFRPCDAPGRAPSTRADIIAATKRPQYDRPTRLFGTGGNRPARRWNLPPGVVHHELRLLFVSSDAVRRGEVCGAGG